MPLQHLDLPLADPDLSDRAAELIEDALDHRIPRWIHDRRDNPIPGFVPADYPLVYQALASIEAHGLASGNRFLEWGSGFGVVTALASLLGYEAHGVEVEHDLVDQAEALIDDHHIHATFARGSYLPPDAEQLTDAIDDMSWLETDRPDGYDELGLDIDDFDIIYVYPWPGEEPIAEACFERFAATGALLLTYRTDDRLWLHRKTKATKRRH
ncbi:class I SAM-dependent methyltransferase [Mucisphaera sp.]|uniref:class I SAM-dependent methyltransferase n=1 Tax=Mucisphaera sp. TaxID=2913024 RepID=UPI003D0D3C5C